MVGINELSPMFQRLANFGHLLPIFCEIAFDLFNEILLVCLDERELTNQTNFSPEIHAQERHEAVVTGERPLPMNQIV